MSLAATLPSPATTPLDLQDDLSDSMEFVESLKLPQSVKPGQQLPTLERYDEYARILPCTLHDLLNESTGIGCDNLIIIDCRSKREFDGGHIRGANNVQTMDELYAVYDQLIGSSPCIVFHCEYSSRRGPEMMKRFLDHDFKVSGMVRRFKDVYLLHGGYKEYYKRYSWTLDIEGGYVRMEQSDIQSNGKLKRCQSFFSTSPRALLKNPKDRSAMTDNPWVLGHRNALSQSTTYLPPLIIDEEDDI